jgi:hypothetical protein
MQIEGFPKPFPDICWLSFHPPPRSKRCRKYTRARATPLLSATPLSHPLGATESHAATRNRRCTHAAIVTPPLHPPIYLGSRRTTANPMQLEGLGVRIRNHFQISDASCRKCTRARAPPPSSATARTAWRDTVACRDSPLHTVAIAWRDRVACRDSPLHTCSHRYPNPFACGDGVVGSSMGTTTHTFNTFPDSMQLEGLGVRIRNHFQIAILPPSPRTQPCIM